MPTSDKGAANVLIIVAIVAALAIGGYFLTQKGGLPTPSITGGGGLALRATEKDFEFIEDATLRKHFVTQANQTSYRTKSTSPGSGLTTTSEFQIKGESFSIRDIESDGSKEKKHMITIDDTIYLKDYSDNRWWKQTIKDTSSKDEEEKSKPTDFKEEYSKPNLKYKSLGKEACGKLTCFKYEESDPENTEVKRTFWFDDKDYLLRKDQGGFGEFIAVVEYSYDGINITAPSPTKDVPEGRNIYEYSTGSDAMPISPTTNQAPKIPSTPTDTSGPDYGDSGE